MTGIKVNELELETLKNEARNEEEHLPLNIE